MTVGIDEGLPDFDSLGKLEIIDWTRKGRNDFPFFISHIFPYSWSQWKGNKGVLNKDRWLRPPEGAWVPAPHTMRWAKELQDNVLTSRLCGRKHLKSTTLYGHVEWKLFKCQEANFEGLYISYKQDMGEYHTGNCKKLIKSNPFFEDVKDLTHADTLLRYSWYEDEHCIFEVTPAGILSFKRGRHPRVVWCDDILADPQNPLNQTVVDQITNVFFKDVMSLPQEGGELHLAGTPQSENDVFFQIVKRGRVKDEYDGESKGFLWRKEPAIVDDDTKEVIWPNLFPYSRLMELRAEIMPKAFSQEYLCAPTQAEEGYFKRAEIEGLVAMGKKMGIVPMTTLNTDNEVYAGWDLGKKQHPAHFSVHELVGNILVQRYQVFWDGVSYTTQFGRILKLQKSLGIDRVAYDDTRGEFEILKEQGKMPSFFEPITFSKKQNSSMAGAFERRVNTKSMVLLDDQRQVNVILQMNNDLKAVENDEGHGDSFWTNAMVSWMSELPKDNNPTVYIDMNEDDEYEMLEGLVW